MKDLLLLRSRDIGIGLVTVAWSLVLCDAANGQGSVESDRQVLEVFYQATGGPDWRHSDNWLSGAPLSEWHGVVVNAQGRVKTLALQDNHLSGRIPPELGQLRLETLVLSDNELTGSLPSEMGQFVTLEYLVLSGNRLHGPIPPELGRLTRLEVLQVDKNQWSGPIPVELGRLTRLQVLSLSDNQLRGPIPPELGQLTRLQVLELHGNHLSGPIPPELGRLSGLELLFLQDNQLTGPIPVELERLTQLNRLGIDADTGLCLPPQIRDTVFGLLAVDNNVPLCGAVAILPPVALWVLAVVLVGVGSALAAGTNSRRNGCISHGQDSTETCVGLAYCRDLRIAMDNPGPSRAGNGSCFRRRRRAAHGSSCESATTEQR